MIGIHQCQAETLVQLSTRNSIHSGISHNEQKRYNGETGNQRKED